MEMLSIGKFPPNVQHRVFLYNPHFQSKSQFPFPTRLHLNGAVLVKLQNGLRGAALKSNRKGGFRVAEMDGPDELEDEFDGEIFDDCEFEGDDDDDDGEVVIPLKNIKKWLENRPRGFGEGKVYDTLVEDKLMEEIEQSRKAQLDNMNKLKNSPVKPVTKKETSKQEKGSTHIQNGFRVRLTNLPKKKNIHRDLRLAFDGVPGILGITPVVSGNEKTRDPVCKGLAFVDFKHLEEAHRFVQNFSGRSLSFGKVQKQVKCEMINSNLPKLASDDQLMKGTNCFSSQADLNSHEDLDESVANLPDDEDEGSFSAESNDDGDIDGTSTTPYSSLVEQEAERRDSSPINPSFSSKQGRKLKTNNKKTEAERRKDENPKLNTILGSAKRLKIRERTLLTGVFSKYGANAAVNDQSR